MTATTESKSKIPLISALYLLGSPSDGGAILRLASHGGPNPGPC